MITAKDKWVSLVFPFFGCWVFPNDRESAGSLAIRPLAEVAGLAPPLAGSEKFGMVLDTAKARVAASAGTINLRN